MRWSQKLPLLDRLRATWIETVHHEQTVGFLGRDEFTTSSEVHANTDGPEAANLIEALQSRIEGLLLYVQHDTGCDANDLDYLDKTPCTCGLRTVANPKGQRKAKDTPHG